MLSNNLSILLHNDLEHNRVFEVGWTPEYLEKQDREKAKYLRCCEFRITKLQGRPIVKGEAGKNLYAIAEQLCCSSILGLAHLVFIGDLLQKDKVRSYKGVFPYKGEIKQGSYLEREVEIEPKWTIIFGMAQITDKNKNECFSIAGRYLQSFILLSSGSEISVNQDEFFKSLIPCLNIKPSSSWINYMKLIPKICNENTALFCFGSDQRGEYVNVQLFFHTGIESQVKKSMNLILNSDSTSVDK